MTVMTEHKVAATGYSIPLQRKHPEVNYPMPVHKPVIYTDGGPWSTHDYACPVCRSEKAVLNIDTARFMPCWKCQETGWVVAQKSGVIQDFCTNVFILLMLVGTGLLGAYLGAKWLGIL